MSMKLTSIRPLVILITLVITAVLVLGIRALLVLRSVATYKDYWNEKTSEKIAPGSFVYLALGDSAAQSIGASSPMKGYVGLVAKHVEKTTGKKVHIVNLSVTGARVKDVTEVQLPRFEALDITPDLVTIDIGSNDVTKKDFDENRFNKQLDTLLSQLPKGTVVAEVSPYFKEREPVANKHIHELASKYGHVVAPLAAILRDNDSWRNYGGDFFHPSNRGYELWAQGFTSVIDPNLK